MVDERGQDEKSMRVPHPIDAYVGERMRLRRRTLGLTQVNLAQALGLTFQQVQKYERGLNRISASRLYELSVALRVPVGYFFESFDQKKGRSGEWKNTGSAMAAPLAGLPAGCPPPQNPAPIAGDGVNGLGEVFGGMAGDDAMELIDFARAYLSIKNVVLRRQIYDLARTCADVTA